LAVPYLGNRYSGAIPFGGTADEIPCGCHRVFHEVDRGWASSVDYSPQDPTLCVEKYIMPLWRPKTVGV